MQLTKWRGRKQSESHVLCLLMLGVWNATGIDCATAQTSSAAPMSSAHPENLWAHGSSQRASLVSSRDPDQPSVESASQRAALSLYETIPAATDSELTPASRRATGAGANWLRSNADAANTRYSSLSQITRANVSQLEVAWTYRSGGTDTNNIQTNPVIVDGLLYAPAIGKIVVALDAESGKELWRFEPPAATERFGENYGPAHRGLIYWPGTAQHSPRLFLTANGYLFALAARDGKPVETFGERGRVRARGPVAPAIYEDVVVVSDLGAIDAFNVVTGAPLWHFDLAGKTSGGRFAGNGTHYYPSGSAWGGIAMDEQRGIVFSSTGAPHPNLVGVDRPGRNAHTNSVIAIDARQGRLLWSFQDIPHDLWDLDIPAAPNLVTITHRGKQVDAVAQVTKQGNTLLLDRVTGKPLFPFRLRRAPVSMVPGERTWPYQPDIQLPEPFARQSFTQGDITTRTPAAHAFVSQLLQKAKLGWFEPPRTDMPIVFYGVHGGAEWSGAAFDPTSGLLYVSANELAWLAWVLRDVQRDPAAPPTPGELLYRKNCAACHGLKREGAGMAPPLAGVKHLFTDQHVTTLLRDGRNAMPPISLADAERAQLLDFLFDRDIPASKPDRSPPGMESVRYVGGGLTKLLDDKGYPGTQPPWGTLNAIDLNTGKIAWKVPLGEYDELTRAGIAKTGTENFGGAMVTAGGLVFCAGTRDSKIRAFDKADGHELWQYRLPYGGYAPPATYEVNGRQYVVIAATGGGKLGGERGDAYVAFALPTRSDASASPTPSTKPVDVTSAQSTPPQRQSAASP